MPGGRKTGRCKYWPANLIEGKSRHESIDGSKGKLKLGAGASIAAGPVGREAEAATNASMSAEMLSYSRAQGVFAGVSLAGTTLGPDSGANQKLYGKKLSARQIIEGQAGTPASADELLAVLQAKSPKNLSAGK